jgi:outer membrane protein OmpA-like peptidoglycan-associated protein
MVLTLGDVLFTSGQADLKGGATANLNKLVTFLNAYPNRTVMIEGHTDSLGSDDFNSGLSQRRADSVKSYLTGQGVGPGRVSASGMGESSPVADNGSPTGRQQNRRVEVIIVNQTALAR